MFLDVRWAGKTDLKISVVESGRKLLLVVVGCEAPDNRAEGYSSSLRWKK